MTLPEIKRDGSNGCNMPLPAVSIIVPVYNVAPYVRECLESIAAQTFSDFECIIVDDGSTDGSGELAEQFCFSDPRFRITHQANQGLSAARNAGLERAQGEWIAFVDSDDICHPDMLECLIAAVRETHAPIACGGYRAFEETPDGEYRIVFSCVAPFESTELADEELFWQLHYTHPHPILGDYAWGKLFHHSLFSELRFRAGMRFEDVELFSHLADNLAYVAIVPRALVDYRRRSGSILRSLNPAGNLDGMEAFLLRGERLAKRGLLDLLASNCVFLIRHAASFGRQRGSAAAEDRLRFRRLLPEAKRQCRLAIRRGHPEPNVALRLASFSLSWRLYAALAALKKGFQKPAR